MKGIQIGARLPDRLVEGLDKYAAQLEREVGKAVPGMTIGRAVALRLLLESALEAKGLLAPEKPGAERAGAASTVSKASTKAGLEADLISGNFETQRALADRYGVDPAQVTRAKKRLQKEGKL